MDNVCLFKERKVNSTIQYVEQKHQILAVIEEDNPLTNSEKSDDEK